MKYIRLVGRLLFFFSLVFMAACGGDGGTTSSPSTTGGGGVVNQRVVSGVAAAGAPIKGAVVLKDSNGVQIGPVNTDDDGNFSFDVTALKLPFMLKAVGVSGTQNYTIYSIAFGYGNAHINPFSNLVLQLAAGSDPATVFGADGSKPDIAAIDDTKMKSALDRINTLLATMFTEYGIKDFDPINGPYLATPDYKLDALLDVIEIKSENGSLAITNKLDGSVIVSGSLTNMAGLSVDKTKCPDKSTLTDIKDITDRLATLRAAMNKGDNLKVQDLEDLFIADPNYGTSNGHTRAADMASIVTIFGLNGTNTNGKLKSIRNVRLLSDQTANYLFPASDAGRVVTKVYLINYDFIHDNGNVVHGNNTTWAKGAATGTWKLIGDPVNLTIGNNYGFVFTSSDPIIDPPTFTFMPLDPPVATIDASLISMQNVTAPFSTIDFPMLSISPPPSDYVGSAYSYDAQAPVATSMK